MTHDQLNKVSYSVAAMILMELKDWQIAKRNLSSMEEAQEYIENDKKSAIPFLDYRIVEVTEKVIA
jgi:hypothetical protein